MFGDMEISLSTNATVDELHDRADELKEWIADASSRFDTAQTRWEHEPDPAVKALRWVEFQAVAREFRVLFGWQNVVNAAFIFATDGADCAAIDAHRTVS